MRTKGVTMQDIAKAAGVSQSTVSMILNGKSSYFPQTTIEKVLSTATNMNYAFRGAPSSSNTVLVIATQLTNPFYTAIIQGMDRLATKESINIITACTYHKPELETAYLPMALQQHFLGVIFLYPPDNQDVYTVFAPQIPIVTVCDRNNSKDGDIVELNNFQAGALAAEHLLQLGHTNIAILTYTSDRSTTPKATRVAGALSKITPVLSQDHLLMLMGNNANSGYLTEDAFHYHVGYSLAQNKKIYQNGVTGLICVNDLMAYGVMDALISKGYRVPEDFSVIGSDNLLFSGMSRVSLTTIEHHPDIVAQSALTTLLNRTHMLGQNQIVSSTARFQVQCQPALIVRGSTGRAKNSILPDE